MSEPLIDKYRNTVYRDAFEMVNDYLDRFGASVGAKLEPLGKDGYTDVRHGATVVGINVDPGHDTLMLLSRIADLPKKPPPGFYRRLLGLNLVATGDCAFAVDEERAGIYLRAKRGLGGLDYEEFELLLKTTVSVAEGMAVRIDEILSEAAPQ